MHNCKLQISSTIKVSRLKPVKSLLKSPALVVTSTALRNSFRRQAQSLAKIVEDEKPQPWRVKSFALDPGIKNEGSFYSLTKMMNRFFMCVLGIVVLGSAAWLVSAKRGRAQSTAENHVKLELVSEQNALVSGQDLLVGIRFILEDGWHTYWINPGDSGEAPRIEWQLPVGFQAGAIHWPYPERLTTPPLTDYGYEHELLLMVPIRLPAKLREGETEKIAALVHFLICRDVCIPGQKHLELSLPVKNRAAPSATRDLFAAARARVPSPAPPNWNISVASIRDEFVLTLQIGGPPRVLRFFPLYVEQIENAASQEVTIFPGGVRLHLKKSKHLLKPIARLHGVLVIDSEGAYSLDVPVSRSIENANAQIAD